MAEWPVPTSVTQVQQFVGLCNYYRRFIQNFARVAAPLTSLSKKDVSFVWGPDQQQAFDLLRSAMQSAPVLRIWDPALPARICCDASDFALGSVLEQEHDAGWLPIEYWSKKLTNAEANYSATDREFLGIVYSLERWRQYLVTRPFKVLTDHASLVYLHSQAHLNRRQARWLDVLGQFTFSIEHVAGKQNIVPDALSRRPDLLALQATGTDLVTLVREAQSAASSLDWQNIVDCASRGEREFCIRNGLVCRSRGTNRDVALVVPDGTLQQSILAELHCPPLGGHLGVAKLLGLVTARFWWKSLYADVKQFVKHCVVCQQNKVSTQVPQGLLQPLEPPTAPFQQVTMDLVTHLPVSERGYDAIATFVDRFSKLVVFVPCQTAIGAPEFAVLFFDHVVCRHGMPHKVISDRDRRFVSLFWQSLLQCLDCKLAMSSSYHPETDGQSERMHRSLEQVLRCFVGPRQKDWCRFLSSAEFALNSTKAASTGYSPFYVVYGREPTLPIDTALNAVRDCTVPAVSERVQLMGQVHRDVVQALTRAASYMARYANQKRRVVEFSVGSKVLVKTDHLHLPQGYTRKLAAKFIGPFDVIEQINPAAFRVDLPKEYSRLHNVFHASQLKLFSGDIADVRPAPVVFENNQVEFEVEDILDVRSVRRGRGQRVEYLVKWAGYSVFDSTWEPASNLTHCGDILAAFKSRRNLD